MIAGTPRDTNTVRICQYGGDLPSLPEIPRDIVLEVGFRVWGTNERSSISIGALWTRRLIRNLNCAMTVYQSWATA
jgi:hypothetical protein